VTSVTVTDGAGQSATGKITVTALGNPPSAVITGAPAGKVDEGKKVSLGSFVTDENPFETFSYTWRVFKNGTPYATGSNAGISFIPTTTACTTSR